METVVDMKGNEAGDKSIANDEDKAYEKANEEYGNDVKASEEKIDNVLKDLLENTTIHGLPKISSSKLIAVKVLWCCLFVVAFILFVIQLNGLVKEYNSNPKQTTVTLKSGTVKFPAITICNMNVLKSSTVSLHEQLSELVDSHRNNQQTNKMKSVNLNPYETDIFEYILNGYSIRGWFWGMNFPKHSYWGMVDYLRGLYHENNPQLNQTTTESRLLSRNELFMILGEEMTTTTSTSTTTESTTSTTTASTDGALTFATMETTDGALTSTTTGSTDGSLTSTTTESTTSTTTRSIDGALISAITGSTNEAITSTTTESTNAAFTSATMETTDGALTFTTTGSTDGSLPSTTTESTISTSTGSTDGALTSATTGSSNGATISITTKSTDGTITSTSTEYTDRTMTTRTTETTNKPTSGKPLSTDTGTQSAGPSIPASIDNAVTQETMACSTLQDSAMLNGSTGGDVKRSADELTVPLRKLLRRKKPYVQDYFKGILDRPGFDEALLRWKTVHTLANAIIRKQPSDFRYRLGHRIEDLMVSSSYAGVHEEINYTRHWIQDYGNCYTIDSPKYETRQSGPDFGFDLLLNLEIDEYVPYIQESQGVRIVLHEQGTVPFPNAEGLTLEPGYEHQIGLKIVETSRLGPPYGTCTDGHQFWSKYKTRYTRNTCTEVCKIDQYINECGCLPKDSSEILDEYIDLPVCELSINSSVRACSENIRLKLSTEKGSCNCDDPCSTTSYLKTVSERRWPTATYLKNVIVHSLCPYEGRIMPSMVKICHSYWLKPFDYDRYRNNFMKVKIYFEDTQYQVISEEPTYGIVRFLSDIGGTGGLFIGASLLSLVEIVHVALEILLYLRKRRQLFPASQKLIKEAT